MTPLIFPKSPFGMGPRYIRRDGLEEIHSGQVGVASVESRLYSPISLFRALKVSSFLSLVARSKMSWSSRDLDVGLRGSNLVPGGITG